MRTTSYDTGVLYFRGDGRPRVWAHLNAPGRAGGRPWSFVGLIDTGADYTMLPSTAANAVQLRPSGQRMRVYTASGVVSLPVEEVELSLFGVRVRARAVLGGANAAPLIGMETLFMAFSAVGFETKRWNLAVRQGHGSSETFSGPLEVLAKGLARVAASIEPDRPLQLDETRFVGGGNP